MKHKFTSEQGRTAGKKSKRGESVKTQQWNKLSDLILNECTDKFNTELMKLEGKEFITSYLAVLNYFKPRLQSTSTKIESNTFTPITGITFDKHDER